MDPNAEEERPMCYMCYAPYTEAEKSYFVRPCRCKGATGLVHQSCLQRWIDQKQNGNLDQPVSCPQCQTEYRIIYLDSSLLIPFLIKLDAVIQRCVPVGTTLIICGSIYWAAVTYGAITIMQVAGNREGMGLLEEMDPLLTVLCLPLIPIALSISRLIPWDDWLLRTYRHYVYNGCSRAGLALDNGDAAELGAPQLIDTPTALMRRICGGLLLPTISSLVGRMLFSGVRSNIQRTLLGGALFLLAKGALKIYFKQGFWRRKRSRAVSPFPTAQLDRPS